MRPSRAPQRRLRSRTTHRVSPPCSHPRRKQRRTTPRDHSSRSSFQLSSARPSLRERGDVSSRRIGALGCPSRTELTLGLLGLPFLAAPFRSPPCCSSRMKSFSRSVAWSARSGGRNVLRELELARARLELLKVVLVPDRSAETTSVEQAEKMKPMRRVVSGKQELNLRGALVDATRRLGHGHLATHRWGPFPALAERTPPHADHRPTVNFATTRLPVPHAGSRFSALFVLLR
jgi:hypothetical protein